MAIFGHPVTTPEGDFDLGTNFILTKFVLSEAASVSKLTAWVRSQSSTARNFKGVIYDDNGAGGSPGTLLGTTNVLNKANVSSWSDLAFPAAVELSAGSYWLGMICDTGYGGSLGETADGAYAVWEGGESYASPGDPYNGDTNADYDNYMAAIYATYSSSDSSSSSSSSSSSISSSSNSSSSSSSSSNSSSSSSSSSYTKYTKETAGSLRTDSTDLGTNFTTIEVDNCKTDDTDYAEMESVNPNYSVFMFKNQSGLNLIRLTWIGQSNYAPSASIVYLQAYNYNLSTWEIVDWNNSSNADTDFTLTGILPLAGRLLSHYVSDSKIACRVYQQS